MLRAASFNATLAGLGLSADDSTFRQLLAAYSGPSRYYHDTNHIEACLTALADHYDLALNAYEVEIALWFHDAIYDTHRNDNEEQSADWAARFLKSKGFEAEAIDRVHALILATKHNLPASGADQCLLVDVDLGILGQPPEAFRKYDAAIRQEYSWVAEPQYRAGRVAVLTSFLDRPSIYNTVRFKQLYEQQARENIGNAVAQLKAGA